MVSKASVALRLRLSWALLTRSTDAWVAELTAALEEVGLHCRGARAGMNPFDFTRQLSGEARGEGCSSRDLEHIAGHDFLRGLPDLDPGWSSEPEVASFLAELVCRLGARCVVETGSYVGYASAHLAAALRAGGPGGHLYLIDRERRFLEAAKANLGALGLRGFSLHLLEGCTWDREVLDALPEAIDLVFLDSDHSAAGIMRELAAYLPRLSRRGCAVIHDSIAWPGVRRVLSDLDGDYRVLTFATSRGNGASVVVRS